MPIDFGTGDSLELARTGPTVDAVLRPYGVESASPIRYPALIDTGASETCIDAQLAVSLDLHAVDAQTISTASGEDRILRYLAMVEIPDLGVFKLSRFPGVRLSEGGQYHRILIGRDLLQDMYLTYDGFAGEGTLTLSQ